MSDSTRGDRGQWAFRSTGPIGEKEQAIKVRVHHRTQESAMDRGWRALMLLHMPFHAPDDAERNRLNQGLREIELLFLRNTDAEVERYYERMMRAADSSPEEPERAAKGAPVRYILAIQARFMEQAFDALRLDRYANAPANRGWMNLFRRWASTPEFKAWFTGMDTVFTKAFEHFVRNFLSTRATIDDQPVKHPWDPEKPSRWKVSYGPGGLVFEREDEDAGADPLFRGVYLDSGIIASESASGLAPATPANATSKVDEPKPDAQSDTGEGEVTGAT